MNETQLSRRQIQAVFLVVVMVIGGMVAYTCIVLPSNADPAGSRRIGVVAGLVIVLAAVWFSKLMVDAIHDRRRGIERGPAKVSARFHIWFGAAAALSGIICGAWTYFSAVEAEVKVWKSYFSLILWGVIQMLIGFRNRDDDFDTDAT